MRCRLVGCFVFFFKQKTAYEMRISDWSSDVCSSDLTMPAPEATPPTTGEAMPPAASPEASAPGMSAEAAQTPADWATFDKDSKGYLTPLEFGNWVMAKQGNDMSAEVEKTKSSKRANIPAVKVLNANGTMFLKADTNGDRRITPDELESAVAG